MTTFEKNLCMFTLRGDITSCAKDGMTYRAIDRLLRNRYIRKGLTTQEFEAILEETYDEKMEG